MNEDHQCNHRDCKNKVTWLVGGQWYMCDEHVKDAIMELREHVNPEINAISLDGKTKYFMSCEKPLNNNNLLSNEVAQAVMHYVSKDIAYYKKRIDDTRWITDGEDGLLSIEDYRDRGDSAGIYYDSINTLKYKWGIDYK